MIAVPVPAGFNFMVYDTVVTGGSTLRADTNGNIQVTPTSGSSQAGNTALPAGAFGSIPVVLP